MMASAGDVPSPPRTAVWSNEFSRWVPIRHVMQVKHKPLLTISILATEAPLPIGVPIRFRFEYPMDKSGIIDTFNDGRPAYAYLGGEVTATIQSVSSRIWGRGCGNAGFDVTSYHLDTPATAWDKSSACPSQIL